MSNRSRGLVVAAVAGLVALTSCGGAPADPAAPASAAPPSAAAPQGHQQGSGHGGSADTVELWAVQSGPLGVVVTDGAGYVLYRSDRDTSQPPTSTCVDQCAEAWHPVLVGSKPPELLGVDASTVGTLLRPDGGTQLTLGGWPVYRRAGEARGVPGAGANGADGVWFAVAPDGSKAVPPA